MHFYEFFFHTKEIPDMNVSWYYWILSRHVIFHNFFLLFLFFYKNKIIKYLWTSTVEVRFLYLKYFFRFPPFFFNSSSSLYFLRYFYTIRHADHTAQVFFSFFLLFNGDVIKRETREIFFFRKFSNQQHLFEVMNLFN